MGDVTFTEEGMSTEFSLETLRSLCKDNKIVRSAKAIYLVFQGPEPIKYDAPCAQIDVLDAPALEPASEHEQPAGISPKSTPHRPNVYHPPNQDRKLPAAPLDPHS